MEIKHVEQQVVYELRRTNDRLGCIIGLMIFALFIPPILGVLIALVNGAM